MKAVKPMDVVLSILFTLFLLALVVTFLGCASVKEETKTETLVEVVTEEIVVQPGPYKWRSEWRSVDAVVIGKIPTVPIDIVDDGKKVGTLKIDPVKREAVIEATPAPVTVQDRDTMRTTNTTTKQTIERSLWDRFLDFALVVGACGVCALVIIGVYKLGRLLK